MNLLKTVGKQFEKAINKVGEVIYITTTNGDTDMPTFERLKVSIDNATQAAYSIVDREFLYKGQMILPKSIPIDKISGRYFAREIQPDRVYMVISIIPMFTSSKIGFIYGVECNEEINLLRYENTGKQDEYGTDIYDFIPFQKNIFAYFTTTNRSQKEMTDGNKDQTIYNLILPSKFCLSIGDTVEKQSFINGKYQMEKYKVDSIDTALTDVYEELKEQKIEGVIVAQMVKDLRGANETS